MFAIIQASGRQFRVEPGAVIEIHGHGSDEAGAELTFDQVLLVGKDAGELMAGAPFVSGAKVLGVVDSADKGPRSASSRRSGASSTGARRAIATRSRASASPIFRCRVRHGA